jgi:TPR repeat protein
LEQRFMPSSSCKGQTTIKQDYREAYKWYSKAADQGDSKSQYRLGLMFAFWQGPRTDNAEMAKWFRLAADQGDADAQGELGLLYESGHGVPQDYVLAHKWLNLAAAQGNKEALDRRDVLAAKMTPAQIAEAQRLASAWASKK